MNRTIAPGWNLPVEASDALANHIGKAAQRAIECLDYLSRARSSPDWQELAPDDVLVDVRPVPVRSAGEIGGGRWWPHDYDHRLDIIGGDKGRVYLWSRTSLLILPALSDLEVETAAERSRGSDRLPILRAKLADGAWHVSDLDLRRDPFGRLADVAEYARLRARGGR